MLVVAEKIVTTLEVYEGVKKNALAETGTSLTT